MLTLEKIKTPGTRLPKIPAGTKFCTSIHSDGFKPLKSDILAGLIVYGTSIQNDEECIRIEEPGYNGENFIEIPLYEFERLGIIEPKPIQP